MALRCWPDAAQSRNPFLGATGALPVARRPNLSKNRALIDQDGWHERYPLSIDDPDFLVRHAELPKRVIDRGVAAIPYLWRRRDCLHRIGPAAVGSCAALRRITTFCVVGQHPLFSLRLSGPLAAGHFLFNGRRSIQQRPAILPSAPAFKRIEATIRSLRIIRGGRVIVKNSVSSFVGTRPRKMHIVAARPQRAEME